MATRDVGVDWLLAEADRTHTQINAQISVVYERARFENIAPSEMRLPDGSYVLAPLLTAKANIILAVAQLKTL